MDQPHDIGDDDFESFLVPSRPPARNEALRRSLLVRTTRALRLERRLRRLKLVVALAGCYAAGLATMWFSIPSHATADAVQVAEHAPGLPRESAPQVPQQPTDAATEDESVVPASVLEQWASIVAPRERSKLYRRAGDRYLEESGDMESAVRCYSRSLDHAAPEDLAISLDQDNWLIMALKEARQKERKHARSDS